MNVSDDEEDINNDEESDEYMLWGLHDERVCIFVLKSYVDKRVYNFILESSINGRFATLSIKVALIESLQLYL